MILLFALSIPHTSYAAEQSLKFKSSTKDIRELSVLDMVKTEAKFDTSSPYGIAAVDLNDDGVDEWVIRDDEKTGCAETVSCRFIIAGLSEKKPIILGQFYAGKLTILDKKMFGVRGLAVYNNPNDDFSFVRYHWNPQISAYSTNF